MTAADLRLGAYADVLSGETWEPMMAEAPAEGRQEVLV